MKPPLRRRSTPNSQPPNTLTTYTYDLFGNLRSVTQPSGDVIDYVVDGQNRRVGRAINGTLARGWLYDGQLRTVAELDGTYALVSRFVYATKTNVPDYMVSGGVTYRLLSDHLGQASTLFLPLAVFQRSARPSGVDSDLTASSATP